MSILSKLLSGWKWVLGALAGFAIVFYRWRADRNAEKALQAQNRVRYMEAKETRDVQLQRRMKETQQQHEKEREDLRERRREGKRGGGLGKW